MPIKADAASACRRPSCSRLPERPRELLVERLNDRSHGLLGENLAANDIHTPLRGLTSPNTWPGSEASSSTSKSPPDHSRAHWRSASEAVVQSDDVGQWLRRSGAWRSHRPGGPLPLVTSVRWDRRVGRKPVYAAFSCACCGNQTVHMTGPRQRYCTECALEVRRDRVREAMRRARASRVTPA
jgi:hypothetical protein